MQNAREIFVSWLSEVVPAQLPGGVVAFVFNLAEAGNEFSVELVGASNYWPEDENWACEESFRPETNEIWLDYEVANAKWEEAQSLVHSWITGFVAKYPSALNHGSAVAVGFVDGNLSYVIPSDTSP